MTSTFKHDQEGYWFECSLTGAGDKVYFADVLSVEAIANVVYIWVKSINKPLETHKMMNVSDALYLSNLVKGCSDGKKHATKKKN